MKVVILYRPQSDHSSIVESFARDFKHRHAELGEKMELVSIDTRDGAATASLYDVMQYPSVIALSDDGRLLNMWNGAPLPLMDEVAGYIYA